MSSVAMLMSRAPPPAMPFHEAVCLDCSAVGALSAACLQAALCSATARVMANLGPGCTEHLYRNALFLALRGAGFPDVRLEATVEIFFDAVEIGWLRVDMVVSEQFAVELKFGWLPVVGSSSSSGRTPLEQARAYLRHGHYVGAFLVHFVPDGTTDVSLVLPSAA